MNIETAKELINKEFDSDDGLHLAFRMSSDVEDIRIDNFLEALKSINENYQDKLLIEKELVYKLFNFYSTLQASERHWKVSRPEGLSSKRCFEIYSNISNIFAS